MSGVISGVEVVTAAAAVGVVAVVVVNGIHIGIHTELLHLMGEFCVFRTNSCSPTQICVHANTNLFMGTWICQRGFCCLAVKSVFFKL